MSFPFFSENRNWANLTIRLISQIASDGADFGEIDRAMKGVQAGDNESWYVRWKEMAEYVEEGGRRALSEGHTVTAWKNLFRASNYYRQAQAVLEFTDSRKVPTYLKTVECFKQACRYHSPSIEPVEIPYQSTEMNGYVFQRYGDSDAKGPGLVWFGGADSPAEELYFQGASEAIRRGLTVLAVNGPGQGLSLYARGLAGRADYEKPFSAAIDFFQKRSGIDPDRIAIMGNSLGGYYVLRAAAFEKRAKACVAYDVAYDVTEDLYDFKPIQPALQWIVGAKDDREAREKLKQYTLKGICSKVTCPVLLVHGEQDYIMRPGAVSRVQNELSSSASVGVKMYAGGHSVREYHKELLSYVFDWVVDALR